MNFTQETTDSSEESRRERRGKPTRYLKINLLQKSLHNWRGQLLLYFTLIVIVFAGMGLIQHLFVHHQVEQTVDKELASWASEISAELAYKDKWDLEGYRNANIAVPSWFILSQDGCIVDIEGIIEGKLLTRVFSHVDIINLAYDSPQSIVSRIGEKWRLLSKKVDGGVVIVGIRLPENIKAADEKLAANIEKFGSTIEKATAARSRAIDIEVDYAVVSATGELKSAYSSIPLLTTSEFAGKKLTKTVRVGDKWFRIYSELILDKNSKPVGTIIVPKDMTLEQQALNQQDRFNIFLVIASLVITVGLTIMFMVRELLRRQHILPIEEALKVGESKTVEFKSTYYWDINQGKESDEIRLAVLKSIAGFLNSAGGTLYIGVEEDKKTGQSRIRGLVEDLTFYKNNKDELLRSLRQLIKDRIGSEFSPFISERIEEADDKHYCIVTVDRSPEPAFVRWGKKGKSKEEIKFYVREGPLTSELDNERTWRYIKSKRWG